MCWYIYSLNDCCTIQTVLNDTVFTTEGHVWLVFEPFPYTAIPNRLPSPTLVSKKQDFDLSSLLQEQIDQRVQVEELVRSIVRDLLEDLEVDKVVDRARPGRRRNYRSRHGEESDEEVAIVATREDGELTTSSEDDKLAAGTGIRCKSSGKNFASACPQLRLAKGSWPVRAALATLKTWRASNSCR